MKADIENSGVVVSHCDALGLATLLVRKGKSAALARRLREHFNIDLPQGPQRTTSLPLALIGMGPGSWLAACERGGNWFAASLAKVVGELASVCDQSDGYIVLRCSGAKVRDALCKLVSVDLHASVFKVGQVAATVAGHVAVVLWRTDDDAHGSAVFEIAFYRSFTQSFWHLLTASAAEFSLRVTNTEQNLPIEALPHKHSA